MSVEVDAEGYLFRSDGNTAHDNGATDVEALLQTITDYDSSAESSDSMWEEVSSTDVVVPFRNNPLHDFESIYWLALYLLLYGDIQLPDGAAEMTPAHIQACRALTKTVFTNGPYRPAFLRNGQFANRLHPMVSDVVEKLDGLRQTVVKAFTKAEANLEQPIPFSVGEANCRAVASMLVKVIKHLRTQDIVVSRDRVGLPAVTDPSVQEGVTQEASRASGDILPAAKKRRTGVTSSLSSRPKTGDTGSSQKRKTRATS